MFNKKLFIDNVLYLAKQKNIGITELEKRCCVSQGYFSRFKQSGDNNSASINLFLSISKLFDVSIDTLLFVDCSTINNTELNIINFLDKMIEQTYNDEIHWEAIETNCSYDNMKKSIISPLFNFDEARKTYSYNSLFEQYRYLDLNSSILINKSSNCYFVFCTVAFPGRINDDDIFELYMIKEGIVHKITDNSKYINLSIQNLVDSLEYAIQIEQQRVRIDDDVLSVISKY